MKDYIHQNTKPRDAREILKNGVKLVYDDKHDEIEKKNENLYPRRSRPALNNAHAAYSDAGD